MSKSVSGRNNSIKGQKPNGSTPATPATATPTGVQGNGNIVTNQQTNPIPTTQPTDSYIPTYMSDLVPELRAYEKLLESERKIDVYLARKKIDLHQSVSQWNNSKSTQYSKDKECVKYLRVFISNIAELQPWQNPANDIANATWTMRIEGRLLDTKDVQDPNRLKFSSFLQAISVDFKKEVKVTENSEQQDVKMTGTSDNIGETRNDAENMLSMGLNLPEAPVANELSPVGAANFNLTASVAEGDQKKNAEPDYEIVDAVEWHFDPRNPVDFDGLDIKRPGSENVECTITIQPKGFTAERLEYSPELASIIGLSQGSLHEAVYSLYKYILMNQLLVNDDSNLKTSTNTSSDNTSGEKTIVHLDDALSRLLPKNQANEGELRPTSVKLAEITPLINAHISPIRPIKIDYTIRVDKASTYGELVFDLEVPAPSEKSADEKHSTNLNEEGISLLAEFNKLTSELKLELQDLETRISTLQLQLNASANKYQFYSRLSKDPAHFLKDYIASSANALKVLSGDEGFNEDVVRRSQFYKENEAMLFETLGVLLANGRM
ncbi:hypothetical protein HG535_0A07230 [Zygotorulaspora mrakii]|uniref:DM2 domain-containing protein n=1 Tax=Zygotorulaspora mrakii TaxID=42260 RepID=A0A7H9AWY2_ZYGMR|nr:uncharacterized protein HG535_0A07230 [Zygotorulaspora mrakii]QLG70781.1 hypothetical protein HG535_0A07230 [Zygotorulaspora mrakii]